MGKKLLNACSMHSISLVYIWNILLYLYHLLQMRPYKDRFVIQPLCHALEFRFSTRTSLPRRARPCCITSRSGWSRRRSQRTTKRREKIKHNLPFPGTTTATARLTRATGRTPASTLKMRTRAARTRRAINISVTCRTRSVRRLPASSRCITPSARRINVGRRVTRLRRHRRTTWQKSRGRRQSANPSSERDEFTWTDKLCRFPKIYWSHGPFRLVEWWISLDKGRALACQITSPFNKKICGFDKQPSLFLNLKLSGKPVTPLYQNNSMVESLAKWNICFDYRVPSIIEPTPIQK